MVSVRCRESFFWQFTLVNVIILLYPVETTELGSKYRRQALEGVSDPCKPFVNVSNNQFFSPGYPAETYPNNTDCIVILEAPPGHLIKLDFRDWFQIEESPGCKNDFLEVRDGPHGFNSQIQRPFCGINQYYPPMITSSDRHLWVHFRSDDNIEYKGFKAVFEFIKRPANLKTPEIIPCVMNRSMLEEGELGKSDIEKHLMDFYIENDMPIDCLWTISVRPNWRIYLQFAEFNLEKPNDCHSNFVQVFSDKTDMDSNDKEFCGSIADTVLSKGNKMFVRFFSESKGPKTLFLANFTAFRDLGSGKNNECNKMNEFYCEDATCIHKSLVCNEKFNCRFRWDEEDEACQGSQSMTWSGDHHIIIIMVIFSLILTGMCITFIYNCITKLIRDHQTIQEYIRQSREQQLNEIDKHVGNGDGQATDKRPSHLGDRSRSPDSSRVSVDSRHLFDADPSGSYAPEGDVLPILIRNEHSASPSNGDGYNPNIYTVDNETPPQTCDSACQTRESLFTTTGIGHAGYNSSGQSTPSRSVYAESPPAPFSTFGYKKEQSLNKFKAEAKIEMVASHRPYSAKSAPDVIVTH